MSERVRELLRRPDKWFLGGGKAALWAPEFPLFLDQPGFWDPAVWLNHRTGPLFAVTVLDEDGRLLPARFNGRTWTPAEMAVSFTLGATAYDSRGFYVGAPPGALTAPSTAAPSAGRAPVALTEEKAMLPGDVLVDRLTLACATERHLTVVAWSAQEEPGRERLLAGAGPGRWSWVWTEGEHPLLGGAVAIGADRAPSAQGLRFTQGFAGGAHPRWEYTPFFEAAPWTVDPWPEHGSGCVYGALAYRVRVPAGGRVRLTLFAAIAGAPLPARPLAATTVAPGGSVGSNSARPPAVTGGPGGTRDDAGRLAASGALTRAEQALTDALSLDDPLEASRANWDAFFRTAPDFRCDDAQVEQAYWYRCFGLRLNAVLVRDAAFRLPHSSLFEGVNPGWFRQQISYSAQVLMRETAWLRDPALAEGCLLNFIACQKADGSLHGAIRDSGPEAGRAFYLANWGRGVRELYRLHGSREFLQQVYFPLARYAGWLEQARGMPLTTVADHWETGQEYMSRYTAVDPAADSGRPISGLKGVDASVYTYELFRSLAWMARTLDLPRAGDWDAKADAVRQAVREQLWDGSFFTDWDQNRSARTGVRAAVGFYPFLTDIAESEHLPAVDEHLLNPAEFDTPYPWPATALNDPTADPEGRWKGRRMACPWNGRAWLMTACHVAEALCEAAVRLDPSLRPAAAGRLHRLIQMLFVDGRPTSYEYYHPLTGQPPYFRATDDYMHSYLLDLIMRYAAGIRPTDEGFVVDPLPLLGSYRVDRLLIRGREVTILYDQTEGIEVTVGGRLAAAAQRGPLDVRLT